MKPDELIELLRAVSNDGGLIEEPFAVLQHSLELECKECGHFIKHTGHALAGERRYHGIGEQKVAAN